MPSSATARCIAFEGFERIESGEIRAVAAKTKVVLDRGERAPVLIFDETTSERVEIDFRGTLQQVLDRFERPEPKPELSEPKTSDPSPPRGRGRPKLGVVPREVTLLPRHWDWLSAQPGGASVALRKLVDEARRTRQSADAQRRGQEATYRFLHALAGNLPGFEEVSRALFAGQSERFLEMTDAWPRDVRDHARRLAATAFAHSQPSAPVVE